MGDGVCSTAALDTRGMPGARPSSPPPSWVAHPNPGPLLLSPPSLPGRCPCPPYHLSTPGSPPPPSPHQDSGPGTLWTLGVCAHLRRGTKEVNPDRSPLLICVLGTPQGSDGGGMGLSQAFCCLPPAPPSSHGDPGTLGTSYKVPHSPTPSRESPGLLPGTHLLGVLRDDPALLGREGTGEQAEEQPHGPQAALHHGFPTPSDPQPPSAVLSPPDRAATTSPQDWDFLPSGVQGFSRGRCTSLSLGSDHKCPCSQPGSQPCWDRAEPGETPRVPVPLHPVQLEMGLLLHPSEPPKPPR